MILEFLFFVIAVVILWRQINEMRQPPTPKAVTKNPKSSELKTLEAYANRLYGERQYLAAEKAYLKVLNLNHKDPLAYTRLGMIYVATRNFDDAVESFKVAAQLRPTAGNWYNLGLAYFENNNAIKAISAIEKSIMFEPNATRYLGLARAYDRASNPAKAIAALEQAVILEKTKKTLSALAEAYAKNHDREKAIETYRLVLELDPNDARARKLVGSEAKLS